MLIKEYRIPLPLTLEEYRIAQLYMIQKKSREESEGEDSGVEIIENKPYTEGPFGSGQYTYKVYHIGKHIPGWFRNVVPKTALEVHEESWNAYPCTKTKFSVPFVEKFTLEVDTVFQADNGNQENIFKLNHSELRQRELDIIDIVNDSLTGSDYKEEEDPSLFKSTKTGRGLLPSNWIESPPNGVIMCSYKLIKVEFRYWGLQSRIERFIHDYGLRRVMLRAHRQAWTWQDEWVDLTMDDIRELERETQLILQRKLGRSLPAPDGARGLEETSTTTTKSANDTSSSTDKVVQDSENVHTSQRRHTGSRRSRPNSSKRLPSMSSNNLIASSQASTSGQQQQGIAGGGVVGGDTQHDDSDSLYSYYHALDTIAISDESDTEYFDAQDMVTQPHNDSDDEFVESKESLPSIDEEPSAIDSTFGDLSTEYLFLVVHGGCGLQHGAIDSTNHDIDYRTLKNTLEEVLNTHYQSARGRITVKSIPTPSIGIKSYDILTSLSPAAPYGSSTRSQSSVPNFIFPVSILPIMAASDPNYSSCLRQLIISANIIYSDFLETKNLSKNFKGRVCILADSFGSIMIYDILSRQSSASPTAISTPPDWKHSSSASDLPGKGATPTASSPQYGSGGSSELISAKLLFEVCDVFMFGSPLGYILSHRQLTGLKVPPPSSSKIYNMFYSVDPIAARIEPVLDQLFTTIPPILIPSYDRFPTGDRASVSLKATVADYSGLFQSSNQPSSHPTTLQYGSTGPKRANSTELLTVAQDEDCEVKTKNSLRPFCNWWKDNRIDYQLEVPVGLENTDCLSNSAYAHIVQARYWEAKEMFSFILKEDHRAAVSAIMPHQCPMWVPFVSPTSTVKWAKKKTAMRIQHMSPNHRAVDVVCLQSSTTIVTLQAKFFYGPLNMVPLSGEMIDIYMLAPKTMLDANGASSSVLCDKSWLNLATVSTDKNGRVTYNLTPDETLQNPGIYPVVFLVKGDHTTASCNVFVLPSHTQSVVFCIDGALTSNFSLSGKDMKIRTGVTDVVRHWADLGYLIIYITGRPDIQKEYVLAWLGLHGFPMGVVSFADALSTDPNNIKLLYLARLIKEVKIIISVAYCSQRHVPVFKELGLQNDQIFIHSKGGSKKGTAFSKRQGGDYVVIDGFDSHCSSLSTVRPAAFPIKNIIGELSFSLPGSPSQRYSSFPGKTKRPRSSSAPKEERRNN